MDAYADFRYATASNSLSEDDGEPGSSSKTKRGSRACDRCRKIKSKCEPTEGDKCKNCLVSGTQCTFQGPSFKRGPPKGYIHAIEQRWQQVECILATIMTSPRADSIVRDLRQDPAARSILDRVESGPYGQSSRPLQGKKVSQEGFYAAIMGPDLGSTYEDRRSRRQSRVSREIVSVQDSSAAAPTIDWQNQLIRRLAHPSGLSSPSTHTSHTSMSSPAAPASLVAVGTSTPSSTGGEPSRRRARIDGISGYETTARGPHDMYTLGDSYYDNYKSTVNALGHLSVNENQDIRYHDESAGLHLLANSARIDDSQTKENGIWKFRSPKEGATSPGTRAEVYASIALPPPDVQDHLMSLYFTYVHPFFPVIHKSSFLALYNERKYGPNARQRKSIQSISDLLLLSMFAFAARYSDEDMKRNPSTSGLHDQVSEGGRSYAADARKVLNTVYQHSRPCTCQALLLMGIREFGVGSMEQGWLFVGMACRMAVDLGMNQNADEWKNSRGELLFSEADLQARRQIWASCCLADKLSSVWQGRPVMFRESDYNVDFPAVIEAEDLEDWQPYPSDALGSNSQPTAGRILSCFREQCKLALILAEIMSKIYPIKPLTENPRRVELEKLEARLHHWLFELPDHLRYCETSRRLTPLPHILALHVEYQFAVLLLHRAFIPNWNDPILSSKTGMESDPLPMKSFDICQGAAAHISSMITAFHEHYSLKRCPPLFNTYLQAAGIMHIVTLMRRPGNTQGTIGLIRCIEAAKNMEATWTCATSVRNLLQGVHVQLDDLSAWSSTSPSSTSRPGKRGAADALGTEQHTDVLPRDVFSVLAPGYQPSHPEAGPSTVTTPAPHTSDETARMFARSLGIPVSPPSVGTPFLPGFEWWPQSMTAMQQYGDVSEGLRFYPSGNVQPGMVPNYVTPQGPFTFDEGQLSSTFTDSAVRDPSQPPHYHHSG
ncbi:fungal-specific transcription factor domain-containing protein [Cristinia sonorae]|uniref:Fungal-specific transcription factor domain-containing protein n=1 Tax=Cristinia sonorae TaxID=1940300 RepID=A0A8K0UKP5_9AGAR|nr:fungal-specific transcription factor domain-containing protein [Cristinia sonorae]